MAIELRGVLSDATASAVRLLHVAEDVSDSNINPADRTNEHAASLEETAAAIERLTATVTRNTDNAHQAMQDVVSAVGRVTQIIAEIEGASREQAAGIEQINQAITQMDMIPQQDAEMAQDLRETAAALERQSRQELTAISAFSLQLNVTASSAAGGGAPSNPAALVGRRQAA